MLYYVRLIASVVCHIHKISFYFTNMNIIRLFSLLTIFGLLYFSTTSKIKIKVLNVKTKWIFFLVVYGAEDKVDSDVEVDDEETILHQEETVTPASDVLVRRI